MSSRFRAVSAALIAMVALPSCDRETRENRGKPLPESVPGIVGDPRAAEYEGNAFHIAQGQRYYVWMNCNGCHAHGGGGMGPPLMDAEWRYGGSMEQIVDTIREGRPNGMPSFDQKLSEQQMWQLAAFVRTLSAQPRQDALPGRADEMSNIEPRTLDERRPVERTSPAADQARPR
ncbi:MAG TPA: c-type cytochrome [Allosphingosinicella sp.]|nr:c-type cytochrome [Allosphingosinicella sp.]